MHDAPRFEPTQPTAADLVQEVWLRLFNEIVEHVDRLTEWIEESVDERKSGD